MGHSSYFKCLGEGCETRWATEEHPPRCPSCGGKKREKLPSVTYVLRNLGWSTEGLKYWAWRMGMEGRELREAMEKEATIGSVVHLAISAEVAGRAFNINELSAWPEEDRIRAHNSLRAWREWRANTRLEMVCSELPLVSSLADFGGTLDGGVASVNGRRGIVDWKTGSIYAEALVQVAAYGMLWGENHPDQPIEEFHLLEIAKDTGAFHHHMIPAPEMKVACEVFGHALALHRLKKPLEALL